MEALSTETKLALIEHAIKGVAGASTDACQKNFHLHMDDFEGYGVTIDYRWGEFEYVTVWAPTDKKIKSDYTTIGDENEQREVLKGLERLDAVVVSRYGSDIEEAMARYYESCE